MEIFWLGYKIELIPADSQDEALAPIGKFIDSDELVLRTSDDIPRGYGQHLVVTALTKINRGDWCLNRHAINSGDTNSITQASENAIENWESNMSYNNGRLRTRDNLHKVISCTDIKVIGGQFIGRGSEIINSPLPQIPKSFIKEWVNNPTDFVWVGYEVNEDIGFGASRPTPTMVLNNNEITIKHG